MPGSSQWSLSIRFPHQNPEYASPIGATCPAHLILYFITRTRNGEQYSSQLTSRIKKLSQPLNTNHTQYLCTQIICIHYDGTWEFANYVMGLTK